MGCIVRTPGHIAILGCGFTGTSAFYQLVDRYPVKEITIFERSGDFGPGYAYRADECRDYMLNNTNDSLCLVPGNRRAFLNWLETKPAYAGKTDPRGHLPRPVFGDFLREVFEATRLSAAVKGIKVTLIPKEATSMAELPNGRVKIACADEEVIADAALLTTGRCPEGAPYPSPPTGSDALYIATHIQTDAFDHISADATVHVLGASLSAYDVINRLFSDDTGCRFLENADGTLSFEPGRNDRHVVLCSRSGRLKALQSRAQMKIDRRHLTSAALKEAAGDGLVAMHDVQAAILNEAIDHQVVLETNSLLAPYEGCETAEQVNDRAGQMLAQAIDAASGKEGSNFLVDLFSDAQIELWDGWAASILSSDAKAHYRANIESAFLSYFAPCPISTAQKLLALHRAGRLSVRKGIRDVVFDQATDSYQIAHGFGTDQAKVLVNTTGNLDRDVESPNQPAITRSLVANGALWKDKSGPGASVDMKSFRANGARNIYVANMMLWGPGFFTSSAFMMAIVVERMLESLFATEIQRASHQLEKA